MPCPACQSPTSTARSLSWDWYRCRGLVTVSDGVGGTHQCATEFSDPDWTAGRQARIDAKRAANAAERAARETAERAEWEALPHIQAEVGRLVSALTALLPEATRPVLREARLPSLPEASGRTVVVEVGRAWPTRGSSTPFHEGTGWLADGSEVKLPGGWERVPATDGMVVFEDPRPSAAGSERYQPPAPLSTPWVGRRLVLSLQQRVDDVAWVRSRALPSSREESDMFRYTWLLLDIVAHEREHGVPGRPLPSLPRRPGIERSWAKLLKRMYNEAEQMSGVHPHARQVPR